MAMKPFTHGLEPSCTTPKGPASAVTRKPSPVKSTMMPRQKTSACVHPPDFFSCAAALIQEEGNRDRDHRENAGREESGQSESKRSEQKR